MSVCKHDPRCPGTGARHELGIPAGILPGIDHRPVSNAKVRRLRRSIIKAHRDTQPARQVTK